METTHTSIGGRIVKFEFIWRLGLSLQLAHVLEGWSLKVQPLFFTIWIPLPFYFNGEPKDMIDLWGFSFDKKVGSVFWGNKTKILYLNSILE